MKISNYFTCRCGLFAWLSLLLMSLVAIVLAVIINRRQNSDYAHGKVIVAGVTFKVELAETLGQQRTGLMYRDYLPERKGMLFIFKRPKIQGFYMKNTFIPLDIIFIDADRKIINIVTRQPRTLHTSQSDRPALYVLEIPAGSAKRHKIKPAMTVELKLPRPSP